MAVERQLLQFPPSKRDLHPLFEEPTALSAREVAPLKDKSLTPFDTYNEKWQTENGTGRMVFNFAMEESPSETGENLTSISQVLLEHGGSAPLPVVVEKTGLPEESIADVTKTLKNVIEVRVDEDNIPKVISEPLKAFIEEKRELLVEEQVIFEERPTD